MIVIQIHARIMFGQICMESIVEYDKRQSIVSKCDTRTPFGKKDGFVGATCAI